MDDVSDPSDWTSTSLPQLEPLDTGLRCRICRDWYTAPMITECSHSFCSLCIRKCIAATPSAEAPCCPICRASVTEVRLRRNQVLEDLCFWFRSSRMTMLEFAKAQAESSQEKKDVSGKRRRHHLVNKTESSQEDGIRRSSRMRRSVSYQEHLDLDHEQPTEDNSAANSGCFVILDDEEATNGLVPCPVCNQRMTEKQVMRHIESCLSVKSISSSSHQHSLNGTTASSTSKPPKTLLTSSSFSSKPFQRLPKLQYSLLNESKLRNKLQDLGIPAHGNKQTLQNRHTEWVSLWNANADLTSPKSKTQLLRELSEWEASLTRYALQGKKEEDLDAWAMTHKSDFQDLIAIARSSVQKKQKAEEKSSVIEAEPRKLEEVAVVEEPDEEITSLSNNFVSGVSSED
ncbi:uncharacterized protein V2V93DRAFT_367390 [Kockiozyma suomiensis]|uniref:uncharacterized protein n=1 Tax=Kockiozyma suomiensis TaxID=1337062 RepID=UPI0033439278